MTNDFVVELVPALPLARAAAARYWSGGLTGSQVRRRERKRGGAMAPAKGRSARGTPPELLREVVKTELAGKDAAIAAYNAVLWKVRAGYVAITYALLAFGFGKENGLLLLGAQPQLLLVVAIFVALLSVAAGTLDDAYSEKKALVVVAKNALMRRVCEGRLDADADLAVLLGISGESGGRRADPGREAEFTRIHGHDRRTWAALYIPAPAALLLLAVVLLVFPGLLG